MGLVAIMFALLVGLPLGIISALKQNTGLDYLSLFMATIGISVPTFIIGVLLIIFLSQPLAFCRCGGPRNGWLRAGVFVAGIVLGLGTMAFIMRLMRSSMLDIKRADYIRTARAKGLSDRLVISRHMLRNALIPVVTILWARDRRPGDRLVYYQSIFNVPGMGREYVTSIASRDNSMIMGTTLFYALLVAIANLSVDLSYGVLDPRIRARRWMWLWRQLRQR